MLENIGLMKGIGGKMHWLNQRHGVIAHNVSNADTPGFQPSDVQKVDFGSVMRASQNRPSIHQVTTNNGHIGTNDRVPNAKNRESKDVYEVSLDENSVILEEQLLKSQKTMADYSTMTSLYRKNIGMVRMMIE